MQNELNISKAIGVHFLKQGASSQLETSSDFHLAYLLLFKEDTSNCFT